MDSYRTDCLVIGAGLAGAAYALVAARAGLRVALVSRGSDFDANSDRAQGGIIYDTAGADGLLAQDILEASAGSAQHRPARAAINPVTAVLWRCRMTLSPGPG